VNSSHSSNQNQALWEKGDFTEVAAFMRRSGEALVKSLNMSTPLSTLDLGCGDGTTAVPLAAQGVDVLGIDIARNLVDAGNKRAVQLGFNRLRFQEGDASDLHNVEEDSFDLTLSIFGAMFAPKPSNVAREMVRVTRHGGRIVMGNWIPNDPTSFVSQLLRISASFAAPPPEGFISPMLWGVESNIVERFVAAGVPERNITMVKDTFVFESPDRDSTNFVNTFKQFYGPTMNAYEYAQNNGTASELHSQLLELAQSQNRHVLGGTSIPATFMKITVQV
jgi:SAM-dependent methyltransferase